MDSDSILLKPTFYALIITGMLILIIIILIIKYYKKIIKSQIITIILMISIVGNLVANHGNLHHILEREYNYNPIKYTYINYI